MRWKTFINLTNKNLCFTEDMPDAKDSIFEPRASNWMPNALLKLGISFNKEEMDMEDFLPKLKKPEVTSIELTTEHKLILKFTKAFWKFSFEFDTRTIGKKKRTQEKAISLTNGRRSTKKALLNLPRLLNYQPGNDYKKYLVLKNCIFLSVYTRRYMFPAQARGLTL